MTDYDVLMRRVMLALSLVADGAVSQVSDAPTLPTNDSRVLSGPMLTYASECQNCHHPVKGFRCGSCGAFIDVVYASPYWLQEQWFGAGTDPRRKVRVLWIALGVLHAARFRMKAKYDSEGRSSTFPEEARLAVGREAAATSVKRVAEHYGYTTAHVYTLRADAARADKRAAEGRERRRYDGTLSMRCMIAATPGSARGVGDEFGVSHSSVLRWRLEHSTESGVAA